MIKVRSGTLGAVGVVLGVLQTAAFAQGTAEQRAACMGDAIVHCPHAIPNKERITACLASKLSQLTPRCRKQFVRR